MTLTERFWAKVDKRGLCWLWSGARRSPPWDYGSFSYEGVHYAAHRLSWELAHGPIPAKLWVLHSCDNPPCVNPGHLFAGTRQDNVDDMVAKERTRSKLTSGDVVLMREMRAAGSDLYFLADRFGIEFPEVSRICSGARWSHVQIPADIAASIEKLSMVCGARSPHARLAPSEVRSMLQLYRTGVTASECARRYGVNVKHAWNIVHGKKWKHIFMEVLR